MEKAQLNHKNGKRKQKNIQKIVFIACRNAIISLSTETTSTLLARPMERGYREEEKKAVCELHTNEYV